MTRRYRDITYTAPLRSPLETQALFAEDPGDWRLIIFHGTPANRYLYRRFIQTAPAGIDVVLPARPGFGRGHPEAVTDFDEQVAAIRPFLPASCGGGAYGDKKIITLGVSYGGELALKAALDFPEAVRGVVTVAALIDEPHDYALTLERLGRDERIEDYVPNRWKKVRDEVAGRRDQIGPLLDAVANLRAPVEVVHGDFDAIVPKSNAETLMTRLGDNARCEIIPGGTHYLELQYPRRLHAAVQRAKERATESTPSENTPSSMRAADVAP
ncbi:MAG: alpha/beta fold hydrolase [Pseudomonadota bacterium]